MNIISKTLCLSLLTLSSAAFASQNSGYIALDAGIFNATFANSYIDQFDSPPVNYQQTVGQQGYTGGLALGYSRLIGNTYFLGAEVSGNLDANNAVYTPGSSSSSYLTDTTTVKNHIDLTLVPGMKLNSTISTYLKLGVSFATLGDFLTSGTTNQNPLSNQNVILTQYNTSNKNVTGFVAGLGVEKSVCKHLSLFAEGDFHDYGNVSFQSFQNQLPAYTHSTHVTSYDAVIGAAYTFV